MVQELMGHADVKTTEIYTHVMEKDVSAAASPLDRPEKRFLTVDYHVTT